MAQICAVEEEVLQILCLALLLPDFLLFFSFLVIYVYICMRNVLVRCFKGLPK